MKKASRLLLGFACLASLAGLSSASQGSPPGFADTSSTQYCVSCHEMKRHQQELQVSSHVKDAEKKEISCSQCHIPPTGLRWASIKLVFGIKDIYAHYFGNPEDLDRLKLQQFTRRFVPDENCLACHKDLNKNVKNEPISEIGKQAHDAYQALNAEKSGNTRSNCVGCHQNMAHLPEFDSRYAVNAKFAARLAALEEEKK
ncbi:cytochrome c3 family protein [Fundidesulfovibrio agrisoli]|uniref:cytochrome c3 family protein n=1 Tax=Fundidesulfovibrio agrisoli TaxID=2922717 RepID=UPI001FABEC9E|nr:NapC/NirT family cytochrome c [Fundidesulfovibrio agrisoli]